VKFKFAAISAGLLVILAAGAGLARIRVPSTEGLHENGKKIMEASAPVSGGDDAVVTKHVPDEYTPYEKLIFKNVSQFHKNFNAREFEKNGDPVADNLRVDSNGTPLLGREAFVSRIGRFVGPFPDVKIDDQIIVVDGNSAAIRFVFTGTQKGDLTTPEGVIPATNKSIRVDGIEFFTFDKDGKLTNLVTDENRAS
jgi:predicted ester cyclase